MWTRTGSVLTVSSRALVEACRRLGVDTDALLREAGIPARTLEDPDARLESAKVSALWARAYERTGDPVLSLHAAEACPFGAYKVIDFMAANAATVGEAFCCAARYFPLVNTAIRLPIDDSGDPVTFDVEDESGPGGVSRPYAEYCLAAFLLHVRSATGVAFPVREVTFVHRAPADLREHERVFGCPVRFESGHNRMAIARDAWQSPARSGQAGVLQLLCDHANVLLERLPQGPDLVDRTRRAIGERLRGGDPSLESVARALGTSARSLQRHLRACGSSFEGLADEVRQATARLYLEQPDIAVAEVAYLLGFSDPSAFSRAFRRWTGTSPARFRAGRARPAAGSAATPATD